MLELIFKELVILFEKYNKNIYIVGGTARDFILKREIRDFDFATDATPEELKTILPDANFKFSKFGSISCKILKVRVDITTLREESSYIDHRHPTEIKFIKDISIDYKRRDFTINALYIDKNYKIWDFCNGLIDIEKKIISFIGDPEKRIKEDPLRILRAYRFSKSLNFKIEPKTLFMLEKYSYLIKEISPGKIEMENKKK